MPDARNFGIKAADNCYKKYVSQGKYVLQYATRSHTVFHHLLNHSK